MGYSIINSIIDMRYYQDNIEYRLQREATIIDIYTIITSNNVSLLLSKADEIDDYIKKKNDDDNSLRPMFFPTSSYDIDIDTLYRSFQVAEGGFNSKPKDMFSPASVVDVINSALDAVTHTYTDEQYRHIAHLMRREADVIRVLEKYNIWRDEYLSNHKNNSHIESHQITDDDMNDHGMEGYIDFLSDPRNESDYDVTMNLLRLVILERCRNPRSNDFIHQGDTMDRDLVFGYLREIKALPEITILSDDQDQDKIGIRGVCDICSR